MPGFSRQYNAEKRRENFSLRFLVYHIHIYLSNICSIKFFNTAGVFSYKLALFTRSHRVWMSFPHGHENGWDVQLSDLFKIYLVAPPQSGVSAA